MAELPTSPSQPQSARCRVAIVEDHRLQRDRTEEILRRDGRFDVVFSGESMPEFLTWAVAVPRATRPHLLVLDLLVDRQPSVDVEVVSTLLRGGLRIVVLSALTSPKLVQSIVQAGVTGVVGKRDSEEDLLQAIFAVLNGEEWMTQELATIIAGDSDRPKLSIQEEQALVLYSTGLTLDEVADAMNVKKSTAREYLGRVTQKYTAAGV